MNDVLNKILTDISHQVLSLDGIDYNKIYMQRIIFLYSIPLSNLLEGNHEDELSLFIDEVVTFEQIELKNTIIFLENFREITLEILLQIFSIASYALAKWRVHGKLFLRLSYLLGEVYIGLISSDTLLDKDKLDYEMLISETMLDFDFANCKSENTSLRLLHYIDFL